MYAHWCVFCAVFYKRKTQIWETSSLRGDSSLDRLGEIRLIWEADKKHILINDPFCLFFFFFSSYFTLSGFVCILFRGFVCVGVVVESIMQFVPLFSPCFTAELFLWQKRPIIFVSFLFLFFVFFSTLHIHSIFVMLPIHVKLCNIHTCLGSEKLLFSVKYVTGNTVVFYK